MVTRHFAISLSHKIALKTFQIDGMPAHWLPSCISNFKPKPNSSFLPNPMAIILYFLQHLECVHKLSVGVVMVEDNYSGSYSWQLILCTTFIMDEICRWLWKLYEWYLIQSVNLYQILLLVPLRNKPFKIQLRCCNNAVSFLINISERHPISRPLGRGMGFLLGIQHLVDILPAIMYVIS